MELYRGVMDLTFSIEQDSKPQWRTNRAVFRWVRGFALHSANIALKPAPFAVEIRTDKREFVKGFPADSREQAEELLERLRSERASLGLYAFLVKHDAPSHFLTRAIHSA